MSSRDRAAAYDRAKREGQHAYLVGTPKEECPYKEDGAWALGPFWKLGWDIARQEDER